MRWSLVGARCGLADSSCCHEDSQLRSFPEACLLLQGKGAMAVVLSDAEKRTLIRSSAESDLGYLWDDSSIELDLQVKFVNAGYKTLRIFVGIADSKPELRQVLAADFGLDPAAQGAAPNARQQVACVLSAWDGASQLTIREASLRAEAKTLGVPKNVTVPERTAMKRVYETSFGKLPTAEQPSPTYLSLKSEEIETEEPTASPLDEVTSADEVAAETVTSGLDSSGRIIVTKKRSKGSLPSGPEDLRMKLRVEANTWIYLAGKFTSKGWLQNLTPQIFQRYCDYFLGVKCNKMEIPDATGDKAPLHPPWALVLHYEHACRKWAFEQVREDGAELATVLLQSIRDPEIKEIHFTSPIALMGRSGHSSSSLPKVVVPPDGNPRKRPRGGKGAWAAKGLAALAASKGKGKGKEGKGKGKGGKGSLSTHTPDGRQICFAFSSAEGCPAGAGCARVHCCRIPGCSAAHSTLQHA